MRALARSAGDLRSQHDLLQPLRSLAAWDRIMDTLAAGHYNHVRYRESINNLTPADVYAERERIKRATIAKRRLQHQLQAA
jgi:hypothetical protein